MQAAQAVLEDEDERLARGEPWALPRVLGDVRGHEPGATVVLLGGVHGNEPAGALAARRVLALLEPRRRSLSGRVVGLAGNRGALSLGVRFVREDLNRRWRPDLLEAVRAAPVEALVDEAREQRELVDLLASFEGDGPLTIVDLHSTSGPTVPFVCYGDTTENRRVALGLPIPSVRGLDAVIEGTLLLHYAHRGHVAISIEGGAHRAPETVRRHAAAVWLVLVTVGALAAGAAPEIARRREELARAATGAPRVVEVTHRHVVRDGDAFVMVPGFSSFQPIRAGDVVAHDRHGAVRAPESGRILMPRYQGQGDDGYFVVRDAREA